MCQLTSLILWRPKVQISPIAPFSYLIIIITTTIIINILLLVLFRLC